MRSRGRRKEEQATWHQGGWGGRGRIGGSNPGADDGLLVKEAACPAGRRSECTRPIPTLPHVVPAAEPSGAEPSRAPRHAAHRAGPNQLGPPAPPFAHLLLPCCHVLPHKRACLPPPPQPPLDLPPPPPSAMAWPHCCPGLQGQGVWEFGSGATRTLTLQVLLYQEDRASRRYAATLRRRARKASARPAAPRPGTHVPHARAWHIAPTNQPTGQPTVHPTAAAPPIPTHHAAHSVVPDDRVSEERIHAHPCGNPGAGGGGGGGGVGTGRGGHAELGGGRGAACFARGRQSAAGKRCRHGVEQACMRHVRAGTWASPLCFCSMAA